MTAHVPSDADWSARAGGVLLPERFSIVMEYRMPSGITANPRQWVVIEVQADDPSMWWGASGFADDGDVVRAVAVTVRTAYGEVRSQDLKDSAIVQPLLEACDQIAAQREPIQEQQAAALADARRRRRHLADELTTVARDEDEDAIPRWIADWHAADSGVVVPLQPGLALRAEFGKRVEAARHGRVGYDLDVILAVYEAGRPHGYKALENKLGLSNSTAKARVREAKARVAATKNDN